MTTTQGDTPLAVWRHNQGLTLKQAARLFGANYTTYWGWEHGRPMPGSARHLALALADPLVGPHVRRIIEATLPVVERRPVGRPRKKNIA